MQNVIKLSAAVHKVSCTSFLPISQCKESETTVLWPWPWPWNFQGFERLSRYILLQTFIKLSAAVHELLC